MKDHAENDTQRMSTWRMAAWAGAALLLLLPLVAMQFTTEVNWSAGDFVVAGVLLFSALGAYEVAARKPVASANPTDPAMPSTRTLYRTGVGLSIAATLLLVWGNGAVSITDSVADVMYYGVALIGMVGVIVALARPGSAAGVVLAAAIGLVAAAAITLGMGAVPNPYVSVIELLGITAFYTVLYAGAAWLLREAAQRNAAA